jgi:hypothetical protein
VAVRKEREKNHETYSICPRHGIDRESFRHDDVQHHDCRGEQARTRTRRYDHITITPLLRGHSPSVTEDVTIMSQEGVSTQFRRRPTPSPASLTTAPTRSPRTQSFFFLSLLVMSARMWKERTSDSQIFDSIQGNYSHFILSVCHTFFAPLGNDTHTTTRTTQILFSESKLNLITARTPKAPSQLSSLTFTNSPLCPNVSSFYIPIRASPCWTTVNLISSIGRVSSICPLTSLPNPTLPE